MIGTKKRFNRLLNNLEKDLINLRPPQEKTSEAERYLEGIQKMRGSIIVYSLDIAILRPVNLKGKEINVYQIQNFIAKNRGY